MITLLKSEKAPLFCTINKDPGLHKLMPVVTLLPVGIIIQQQLTKLCEHNPFLRIMCRQVMPDHLHFELFVTERTELHLGSYIASFKSACSTAYWKTFSDSPLAQEGEGLFLEGFNDKIVRAAGSKDAFYTYISDNPRRYLIKKLYSDYFFHKLKIEVNGKSCGLYGNIFLLDNPVKSFVKISREKHKTPNLEMKIKEWEETIRCGGVLVSPFINPEEKAYRDLAIKEGAGIILIVDYRFTERTKPYKSLFDLCGEGRLLIVSTEEFASAPKTMRYQHARELNLIAALIAEASPGKIRPKSR